MSGKTKGASSPFVSRGGLKLDHALREFDLDVTGLICADFGCHAGGFTDCLLQHGAARVFAVDTGYGVLDYSLRSDPRVVVMERTNVLHAPPPAEAVNLVTIDLSWTRQRHAIPAALAWLEAPGRIVTLIKPHYELEDAEKAGCLEAGVLDEKEAASVLDRVLASFGDLKAEVLAVTPSPIGGAKSARRSGGPGNREYLVLTRRLPPDDR